MWPLISPASGAPVSFIFDLIRLWPVFHISGLPPISAMRSNRVWLALTSAMIVAPGRSFSTGPARMISSWSPQITRPLAVDRADAVGVAVEGDAEVELLVGDELLQVGEVGLDRRVGVVVGEGAVDLGVERVMLARQALDQLLEHRAAGAVARVPADPIGLAVEALDQRVDISVDDVVLARPCPAPSLQSPSAARRPRSWISAPNTERPFSSILKPL